MHFPAHVHVPVRMFNVYTGLAEESQGEYLDFMIFLENLLTRPFL